MSCKSVLYFLSFSGFLSCCCLVFPGCGMLRQDAELLCVLRGANHDSGPPKKQGEALVLPRSSCMNVICGCSGTYQSNAKCCSVLLGLFVMPVSKHKQIDRLAPAAAYDIYTTCMIQHASLGKQACVLCILVLFQTASFQE